MRLTEVGTDDVTIKQEQKRRKKARTKTGKKANDENNGL